MHVHAGGDGKITRPHYTGREFASLNLNALRQSNMVQIFWYLAADGPLLGSIFCTRLFIQASY
jgi:hypothetical protein